MRLATLSLVLFSVPGIACQAGSGDRQTAVEASPAAEIERAIVRTLPLMQSSMDTWIREATCLSCHHQGLGTMAVSLAKERGFGIDQGLLDQQVQRMGTATTDGYPSILQGDAGINASFGQSYLLLALAAAGHPRDDTTDARAYYLAGNASESGAWYSESHRPPLEDSPFTATAIATRAILLFGPEGRSDEIAEKVRRGGEWLEASRPASNEERVMRLLGLGWGGASREAIEAASDDLAGRQRADGGWAQIPSLESDAYATGQVLVALQQFGGVPVTSNTYRRGVRFLLDTQLEDGSWLVETRRRSPGLPYFESGFPHKLHQFISFAGTAWATMALCLTVDPGPSPVFHGPRPPRDATDTFATDLGMRAVHLAAAYGTLNELRAALDVSGSEVDAEGPGGLTPLMLALHDERKVALLLESGAEIEATTALGYTPVILAGWYSGADGTLAELLERGASGEATAPDGSTALLRAARTGDVGKVVRLLDHGVDIEASYFGLTSLLCAEATGNVDLVELLLDRGANIEAVWPDLGATALNLAAFDGWTELVHVLIERGAAIDATDSEGMTALAWAAKKDHGHTEIAAALLRAGADPAIASTSGRTPLDWAESLGNPLVAELLREAFRSR